ncbi:hypothetical protein F4778DRAFT_722864 [Xylariomycetidae sp. FL2044]|nr:hypothetical protein F4778DRAFT_722864 [Xylariomycetidae sp. FL2044]
MLGSSNTFDPNTAIPSLAGKVYVVTGGSAGIGYGISAHILQHGPAKLYLIGKKEEHLAEAEEGLKAYGDTSVVELIRCDLEDLAQTNSVAKKLGVKAIRPFMKDPVDEGCRPMLFVATSPDVAAEGIDGAYVVPDRKVTEMSKQALDEELQERCWNLVEGILKDKLGADLAYGTE